MKKVKCTICGNDFHYWRMLIRYIGFLNKNNYVKVCPACSEMEAFCRSLRERTKYEKKGDK